MMANKSYRESHTDENYGARYSNTYGKGYYLHQWKKLEEPLLRNQLRKYKALGIRSAMDFACGTGRILSVLEEYFDDTVGIDLSWPMLQYARQVCTHSKIICQDITIKPIYLNVDMVTAFRFFVNAEPTLQEDALRAIHGCLKPGGILLANVHQNASSILGIIYRLRNIIMRRKIANVMGYSEIDSLLNKHGFTISETIWYSFLPRPGWWGGDLCGKLMLPFESLCKCIGLPRHFAQCFMVCAVKQ